MALRKVDFTDDNKCETMSSPSPKKARLCRMEVEDDDDLLKEDEDTTGESLGLDEALVLDGKGEGKNKDDDDDYKFEVLSNSEVEKEMEETLSQIKDVLDLPASNARILLNYTWWDKERLLNKYYENVGALLKEVDMNLPLTVDNSTSSLNLVQFCGVCYAEIPSKDLYGLGCGDSYCVECWGHYLTSQINEGMSPTISCMAAGCFELVDEKAVMSIVKDAEVIAKYKDLAIKDFVKHNKLLTWCPAPDCTHAIKVEKASWMPVTCKCKHNFCFLCGNVWHEPIDCEMLKKWLDLYIQYQPDNDNDSATAKWMKDHTKECPNCNATIEKNGGCNHITCTNCQRGFCWMCMSTSVGHYSCNRFVPGKVTRKHDSATSDKQIFYYERYRNHLLSLNFEWKLYETVEKKIKEMEMSGKTYSDNLYLYKAVDVLCKCRQTLRFSYPFAFFLKKNNQCLIFEDNQRDLEAATEKLSGFLERKITYDNLDEIKQNVLDMTLYCNNRRTVLMDHVHEGYDKKWWNFTME